MVAAETKQIATLETPKDFTFNDILKSFYAILTIAGGKMTVTKHVLENEVPVNFLERLSVSYVPERKAYLISIKKPKLTKKIIEKMKN